MKVKRKIKAAASPKTTPARQRESAIRATTNNSSRNLTESKDLTALGNLAAGIAHELRQPLSTIQLIASHLKSSLASSNGAISKNLDMLEQQAELAGQILSNMVSFARSGKPRKTQINLHQILETVLDRISWPSEISLQRRLARRLPPVCADPLHVDRIIANLIANGLESMEAAGTLTIITVADPAGDLIRITDTGCGIHPDHYEKIFLPFATTKNNGTGIGLALCRQLAEANGGSMSFDSSPGKGTTFELRLPRA